MVSKPLPRDPVLVALANAPMGEPESDAEREAVEAAMAETKAGARPIAHDELVSKITAARG